MTQSYYHNHGCGQGDYFVEVHEKRLIEHGHTESEGILYYLKDDGTYTRVKKSQLVYDDTVKAYALPGIEYYISSFPVEDDSYKAKVVMAKDATGESTRFITYYPRRQLCVSETRCDLCGWNTTSYNIYDSTTTATAVDSSTHHILVKCSHCGYKYEEYDTDHNFSYGEYTPVILSSGKSTQHSVTRTCIAKLNSPSCGYSDTIKEDHTWEYSDCTSVDGKTHNRAFSFGNINSYCIHWQNSCHKVLFTNW